MVRNLCCVGLNKLAKDSSSVGRASAWQAEGPGVNLWHFQVGLGTVPACNPAEALLVIVDCPRPLAVFLTHSCLAWTKWHFYCIRSPPLLILLLSPLQLQPLVLYVRPFQRTTNPHVGRAEQESPVAKVECSGSSSTSCKREQYNNPTDSL